MAAKVKFPLKMANGALVRTLDALREHFDLKSVLGYYDNGRLYDWLMVYYYDDEAKQIKAVDSSADDFKKSLCDILGVPYAEDESVGVDLSDISERNKRLTKLRTFTADDAILAAVDNVAFTQGELDSLTDKDVDVIYLCGEQFNISADKGNIRYIGVNKPNPKGSIPDNFTAKDVVFECAELDVADIIILAKVTSDNEKSAELWRKAAEQGNAEAECELGSCYSLGNGVEKNFDKAAKWFRKAAERGHAEAQYELGSCYSCGNGVDSNKEEAVSWLHKAAEQGYAKAQCRLGGYYFNGNGVEKNFYTAVSWFRKAAERGHAEAQYGLGRLYYEGWYVNKNEKEGLKWIRKAAEQGDNLAISWLYKNDSKWRWQ